MSSSFRFHLKFLLFFLVFCSVVSAQNINDALRLALPGIGPNARSLGMGNSYIGLSDDAAAAYFNPAGFGLLKRVEFSGGISYSKVNNDATFFGNTTPFSNTQTRLDRLSFALPIPTERGSLVFGISYHNTKDLTGALKFNGFNTTNTSMIQDLNIDSSIPYNLFLTDSNYNTIINGQLQQNGAILSSGGLNNWTFSAAIEVYKNIFVGGNLDIITGNFKYDNDYYETDINNIYQGVTAAGEPQTTDFQSFYLNRILNWDLSGWDAKLGFLYQVGSNARIGFTVQFPKSYTVSEDFTASGSSHFGTGQVYTLNSDDYTDHVKYDIITPYELGAGFSVSVKGAIVNAEATLIDYSQLQFDNPDGLSDQYVSGLNKDIKDQLTAVFNYNIGLEYTITDIGLRLRGGYFVQPSAYKSDPSAYDRKYFTAGVGILAEETVGIDLGYAHGWWKDFGDNYGTNVSRTFQDISHDRVMFTATYRF